VNNRGLAAHGGSMRLSGHATEVAAVAVLVGTLARGACHLLDAPGAGDAIWTVTLGATVVALAWTVMRSLIHGDLGST
jgi:hypothetical protein